MKIREHVIGRVHGEAADVLRGSGFRGDFGILQLVWLDKESAEALGLVADAWEGV